MFSIKKISQKALPTITAVVGLLAAGMAHATVGLYNTGVDDNNGLLAVGTVDSHYTLTLGGSAAYVTNDAEGYLGYWLQPNTSSRWITPLLGSGYTASGGYPSQGNFSYQTTFDLTGIDLATAVIRGRATADNGITDILINGQSTGFVYGSAFSGAYSTFANFSVGSGFRTGINTLTFNVVNGSGPTGLRVEFSGSSLVAAVPEPETYAMLLAGLGLIGAITRRRSSKDLSARV